MNNMENYTAHSGDSYYQPAGQRMSAAQQMYLKNHPEHMNSDMSDQYKITCNSGNNWLKADNNMPSNNTWQNNNNGTTSGNNMGIAVRPPMNQSGGTISLTPETLTNTSFLPAYLSQYIGHWIRADFFIGESIEQRVGVLHEVGASYFIIEAIEPQTLIVCDMFSVKFVTIVLDDEFSRLLRF
jgi:hypothetical protein